MHKAMDGVVIFMLIWVQVLLLDHDQAKGVIGTTSTAGTSVVGEAQI